ncbi:MAG: hypothetical protein FWE58_01060 [Methanobrevibacter sp.]|nr:hypothetical protein [Methanobrevibacter sp.]
MDNSEIMETCKFIISGLPECKGEIGLSDEEVEDYLKMVENLKPQDVSRVLEVALKIRESGDIKNVDLKNEASKLIRSIEEC